MSYVDGGVIVSVCDVLSHFGVYTVHGSCVDVVVDVFMLLRTFI